MEGVPKFERQTPKREVDAHDATEVVAEYASGGTEGVEEGYETLKVRAEREVATEFERRVAGYEAHDTTGRLAELHDMLTEYSAVIPGTREPIDNALRFHAFATQERILQLEAALATPSYRDITTPPAYLVKAHPSAYQGMNDNRMVVDMVA